MITMIATTPLKAIITMKTWIAMMTMMTMITLKAKTTRKRSICNIDTLFNSFKYKMITVIIMILTRLSWMVPLEPRTQEDVSV